MEWIAPLRQRYANLFDDLGIASAWQVPPAWLGAPTMLQCLALARVLSEALANIVKYSQARQVQVDLTQPAPHALALRVRDDGVGFDVQVVQRAGLSVGLRSMQVRLARLGGTLEVTSQSRSTQLLAQLPSQPANPSHA